MYHDTALAVPAKADPRPRSAVSGGVGAVGLAGMIAWIAVARFYGMDGPYAALVNVAAAAVPMVLWSLLVDKVHRNPTTGIDWTRPSGWRESAGTSVTKLAGLWFTWGGIAAIYGVGRFWSEDFPFAMWCLETAAPALFVLSIPYVFWLDRYLVQPRDGAWALGAWLMGTGDAASRALIPNHLRSWAVKGFFLAFMLSVVPPNFADFLGWDLSDFLRDPVSTANWLVSFMFVLDVGFATAGYVLTMRPLDSHIRSANPYAAGWTAALICYPPFVLMSDGGPLDYHPGSSDWSHLLWGHEVLLWGVGATLVVLTGIYAWATVAFGLRFSNLTNRGILTHGPYAFSRHPAYLAKNLFWWLSTVPMLTTTGSWSDAIRNTAILGMVSGVYFWRAKTEERHLREDPDYVVYWEWMERNGVVPRAFARARGLLTGQNRASS